MKKIIRQFPMLTLSILPIVVLLISAWQNPGNNYSDNARIIVNQKDTMPNSDNKENDRDMHDFDKTMKALDDNMAHLDEQMKDLNINIDKQIEASLSKINFEEIEKQTEASIKQIDWNKMQQQVDNSLQQAQQQIAKIDFSKMQNDMKDLQ